MFALAGWKIYKKRVGQKQTDPIWKQRGIGCGRPRGSKSGYRTELPGTDPLQGPSPSHPRPPATVAIHDSVRQAIAVFFFGEADFFSAKRLFFRAARDVSGVRSSPPWARVVIKLKMSFQALSHSPSHERALALTSPPPDFLFSSIHLKPPTHQPTNPPQKWNIPYWYCLPSTPSLTLPPSSLKCLQKSNPNIHIKCFRCFKCFGCFRCFMFAFGPQNRPILVQIGTKQVFQVFRILSPFPSGRGRG